MSTDPPLRPCTLKNPTLKNLLMISAHESACPEVGMPETRCHAYCVERAGIGLTMPAGSRDSPADFNNILAGKDDVVGWMQELTDEWHEHGCAVMIRLARLHRWTRWDNGDWLPVVPTSTPPGYRMSPSPGPSGSRKDRARRREGRHRDARDRMIVPEVMATSLTPSLRILQNLDAVFTPTWWVVSVRRDEDGRYRFFRIADAVAARNTHPAYDALRPVGTL